jgi:methionyl-tRNA formyltransferase
VAGSPSRIAPLLAALDADLAISAAFPMLIPADALDVPPMGIINTHPSLLPRYRGPNPIAWTVRNGDRELGYSVHRMDVDFDTGPLLAQGTTPIDDVEDSSELFERMFTLLGSLLPNALARVEQETPATHSQAGTPPTPSSSNPSTSKSTGRRQPPRYVVRCWPGALPRRARAHAAR